MHFYGRFFTSESFQVFRAIGIFPDPSIFVRERVNPPSCPTYEDYYKDYCIFLERMERFRAEKGISQAGFANQLGFSLAKYKRIITRNGSEMSFYESSYAVKLLEKVSLKTAMFGSRLDPIAVALDDTSFNYEFKWRSMLMFELMDEELCLTDQYILEVAERAHILKQLQEFNHEDLKCLIPLDNESGAA